MSWLRRNSAPIGWVLLAAAVVIAGFEVIDAFNETTPTTAVTEAADADLDGVAVLAGLLKVALFLTLPAAITLAVRRRLSPRSARTKT